MFADRLVGFLLPEKNVFYCYRKPKHFFRVFSGFGLNRQVVLALKSSKIKEIWVFYENAKHLTKLWKSKVEDWIKYGEQYEWKGNFNGNHLHEQVLSEQQLVLNKKYFKII